MNDLLEPEIVHPETGEIMNGDQEPGKAPDAPRAEQPGLTLAASLHSIFAELPVWITVDEEANIELKSGGKFKVKYATLKAILSVVRPIALKHGVRIRQGCEHAWSLDSASGKGRAVPVFTDLIHSASGQFERTVIEIPLMKMDAMGMGSAVSFGRRYGLLAAFGLATDESDDNGTGTKQRDLSEAGTEEESQILWEIRAEIRECQTQEELGKVREKIKTKGTLEKLTDAEMALARVAFIEQRKKLEKANDAEVKKGK